MRHSLRLATALLFLAAPASAQVVPGRFQVNVEGAFQQYADEASLQSTGMAGLRATYFLNGNIGVGAFLLAGRPISKGEDFPYVRYTFMSSDETNDTTLLYSVSQRVTHLQYGVDLTLRQQFGRFAPFVSGGIGQYRMFLNPEQKTALTEMDGMAYQIGGGLEYTVTEDVGIRFGVTDQVMLDYDRELLCIACTGPAALMREDRYPNPWASTIKKEDTLHNLRFMGSFNFIPGGRK